MGSVIKHQIADVEPIRLRRHRWSLHRTKVVILLFYLIAIPAYVIIGVQPSSTSVAETLAHESENASGYLIINSIGLSTPVADVYLRDRTLNTPEYIAGSFSNHDNKTLLIGHSTTVFKNLKDTKLGDIIDYNSGSYRITNIETRAKDKISMAQILAEEKRDTIVLMTCAGESLGGQDYTHRLIITAEIVD